MFVIGARLCAKHELGKPIPGLKGGPSGQLPSTSPAAPARGAFPGERRYPDSGLEDGGRIADLP